MSEHGALTWEHPRVFAPNDAEVDLLLSLARPGWMPSQSMTDTILHRLNKTPSRRLVAAATGQLTEILINSGISPGELVDGRFVSWPGTLRERSNRAFQEVLDRGDITASRYAIGNVALLPVQHFDLGRRSALTSREVPLETDPDILDQWRHPQFFTDSDDPELYELTWLALSDWTGAYAVAVDVFTRIGDDRPLDDIARATAEITGLLINNGVAPGDLLNRDIAPWNGTREQRMHRVYQTVVRYGRIPDDTDLIWWGNAALIPQAEHPPS